MDTKRIYRESRGSNYTGYNRASSRRKRSVHVKKLFVGIFSLFMIENRIKHFLLCVHFMGAVL